MRKATIIQLAKVNNLIENYRILRKFLIDAALVHQVQAFRANDDFNERVYHARCYVVSYVCLILLKEARHKPSFRRYLDRISGQALSYDLDKRHWVYGPEGLLFPQWLSQRVLIILDVKARHGEDGDLQIAAAVNSRFKVMLEALGLDRNIPVSSFRKQIFDRFAQIQLSCEPFPKGSLPQWRLLESELKALFLREGGFYELS